MRNRMEDLGRIYESLDRLLKDDFLGNLTCNYEAFKKQWGGRRLIKLFGEMDRMIERMYEIREIAEGSDRLNEEP